MTDVPVLSFVDAPPTPTHINALIYGPLGAGKSTAACDCADQDDPLVQAEWFAIDDAVRNPDKVAYIEQPSERERREHRLARDERAARTSLYPTGQVIALPRRPPINDDGPGMHPEAA